MPLCWLYSLTPVTYFAILPGIHSLAVAMYLEIHRVYIGDGSRFHHSRQVVAYAGLNPKLHESGQLKG
nr:transposase [Photorhabdus noenieputensis]